MSNFPRSGIPLVAGVVQMTVAPTALLATDQKKNGWAGTKDGQMYNIDSPSAVPSSAILRGGIAYSPDGGMYTTTAVPTASSTVRFGRAVRNDGAMHIDKTASGLITHGIQNDSLGAWITT